MKYKVFTKNQIWAYDMDFDSAHNENAKPIFVIETLSDEIIIQKYSKTTKCYLNIYYNLMNGNYKIKSANWIN